MDSLEVSPGAKGTDARVKSIDSSSCTAVPGRRNSGDCAKRPFWAGKDLVGGPPAVNMQNVAGHHVGGRRSEVDDGADDILRLRSPVKKDVVEDILSEFLEAPET